MKMTKSLKKKWIKALLSGEYGQIYDTLCDNDGNYCCLGVLEHVALKGEVEVNPDTGAIRDVPSLLFYDYAGIVIDKDPVCNVDDTDINCLVEMNDDYEEDDETGDMVHHSTFKDIAIWIDKNIETF